MLKAPIAAASRNKAAFGFFASGEFEYFRDTQRFHETADGATHQQGFFLPVVAQKLLRAEAVQDGQRLINFHAQGQLQNKNGNEI
jgi:hypothetical protein